MALLRSVLLVLMITAEGSSVSFTADSNRHLVHPGLRRPLKSCNPIKVASCPI